MKFTKFIPHYLFLFFLLLLGATYIVDNPLGNKLADIASVIFLLYLIAMLIFNIVKDKRIYKIVFSILKIVLYLVLAYLCIKKNHIVDMDAKWRISSYINKIGCLFLISFPMETIIDSKIKSIDNEEKKS